MDEQKALNSLWWITGWSYSLAMLMNHIEKSIDEGFDHVWGRFVETSGAAPFSEADRQQAYNQFVDGWLQERENEQRMVADVFNAAVLTYAKNTDDIATEKLLEVRGTIYDYNRSGVLAFKLDATDVEAAKVLADKRTRVRVEVWEG